MEQGILDAPYHITHYALYFNFYIYRITPNKNYCNTFKIRLPL